MDDRQPTMSMFLNPEDCYKARDKWLNRRIARLEAELQFMIELAENAYMVAQIECGHEPDEEKAENYVLGEISARVMLDNPECMDVTIEELRKENASK